MKFCHFNLELNCRFSDKIFDELEKCPGPNYQIALKLLLSKYMDSEYFSFDFLKKNGVAYVKGADYVSAMALQGYKFEDEILRDDVVFHDGCAVFWWTGRLQRGAAWKYDQSRQVYLTVKDKHRAWIPSSLEDQYRLKVRELI
jgi:hypothetical protein